MFVLRDSCRSYQWYKIWKYKNLGRTSCRFILCQQYTASVGSIYCSWHQYIGHILWLELVYCVWHRYIAFVKVYWVYLWHHYFIFVPSILRLSVLFCDWNQIIMFAIRLPLLSALHCGCHQYFRYIFGTTILYLSPVYCRLLHLSAIYCSWHVFCVCHQNIGYIFVTTISY